MSTINTGRPVYPLVVVDEVEWLDGEILHPDDIEPSPPKPDGKDPAHMAKVAQLPCAVCHHFGMVQTSPTQVHHTISGRHGHRKTPDKQTIPLCMCHHQGLRFDRDIRKIAIHSSKREWEEAYGPDTDFIAWTLEQIERLT